LAPEPKTTFLKGYSKQVNEIFLALEERPICLDLQAAPQKILRERRDPKGAPPCLLSLALLASKQARKLAPPGFSSFLSRRTSRLKDSSENVQ